MSIRDFRQLQLANMWVEAGQRGIIHACPRFGKIRTTIIILRRMNYKKVLIAYPDKKIKASWESDFKELGYDTSNITYTTHLSLKKHITTDYDLIVLDEIHLLSNAQVDVCKSIFPHIRILGLTGTMTTWTEKDLRRELDLRVVGVYPISMAIKEGVIADYEIIVASVPLDNKVKLNFKGKYKTEKTMFDQLGWIITKLEGEGRDTMFMRLARMRIIQSSLAKLNKTVELLNSAQQERILVFCGTIAISDNLGIPSHHSKSGVKELFNAFSEGRDKINHMAVVKIGNTGVTYKPLNRVIINYFDSNAENLAQKINRCMSMEYDNPNKKANIWIISTTEPVEAKWLNKALEFFDKSKIKYV